MFIVYYALGIVLFAMLWEDGKFNIRYIRGFWFKSFDFKSKTSRKDFWITWTWVFLINFFIVFGCFVLFLDLQYFGTFGASKYSSDRQVYFYLLTPLLLEHIITLIPSLSLQIRRLRDISKNPIWILIGLIPFGGIILLILYLSPSQEKKEKKTILQKKLEEIEDLLNKEIIDQEEYKYMRKQIISKHVN